MVPNTGMQEPYDQYKMLQLYLNDVVIDNWGPDNTLVKDVLSQQPENGLIYARSYRTYAGRRRLPQQVSSIP